MRRKVYQAIAGKLAAIQNCRESNNAEWLRRHSDSLRQLVSNFLPSGSGFDCGTKLHHASKPDRLELTFDYHHMDQYGSYDGWSAHDVVVTPSMLNEIDIEIEPDEDYAQAKEQEYSELVSGLSEDEESELSPHDHESFLEYAAETLHHALTVEVVETVTGWRYADSPETGCSDCRGGFVLSGDFPVIQSCGDCASFGRDDDIAALAFWRKAESALPDETLYQVWETVTTATDEKESAE